MLLFAGKNTVLMSTAPAFLFKSGESLDPLLKFAKLQFLFLPKIFLPSRVILRTKQHQMNKMPITVCQ